MGPTSLIRVWTASQVFFTLVTERERDFFTTSQNRFIKAVADAAQHGLRYPSHRVCHWLNGACRLMPAAPMYCRLSEQSHPYCPMVQKCNLPDRAYHLTLSLSETQLIR